MKTNAENNNSTKRANHGRGSWKIDNTVNGYMVARKQFGYKSDGKPNIVAFYGNSRKEVIEKYKDYETYLMKSTTEASRATLYDYMQKWMVIYKFQKVKGSYYD